MKDVILGHKEGPLELQEAFELVLAGRAVLFTGAGFSLGATNLRDAPFKTGGGLATHLAKLSGLPESTGLEDASEWFVKKFGRERLVQELHDEFTVKQISQAHVNLLARPWRRIYTTNYDNVAEVAAARSGKRLTPATLPDDIRALPRTGTLCVHLNGFIDRVTISSLDEQIKLTDTSYLTNIVSDSPWATVFRQDMDAARAVFFVGYSTADIDIRRLLYERPELREKSFFVVGPQNDPVIIQKLSRFGVLTDLDLHGLNARLTEAAGSYSPERNQDPLNYCVRKYEPPSTAPDFEDRLVFDLLLRGDLRDDLVWFSLHGSVDYFVDVPGANAALKAFADGRRVAIIHSDLGNGKSAALEALGAKAFDSGYDVYRVEKNSDTLLEELQSVFASNRKTLLVVEQYHEWLEPLDFISKHAPNTCVLALSARSATHDVFVERVERLLSPATIVEIPVDELREAQCERIVKLFDQYGLWGELAARSKREKLRHLMVKCRAEWHAILIDRLDAPQIQAKLAPVVDALSKQKRFYETVMATLVLNVLEYYPSVDLLLSLLGQSVLEREFREDASVREVLDASSGRIRLRSAVVGQYILTNFADPNALAALLTRMAKAADNNARTSTLYFELLKDLTRFSNLQLVFPEKERRRACILYYESIKDLNHTRKNPLFWLQYAVACTVFEDFERAKKYFDTAYAFAEARDAFNTYQIDNHYARFLLARTIRLKDSGNCMRAFRDARKLIFEQIQGERRHFPFRVATAIGEFYDTFAGVLSAEQRREVAQCAKYILGRIGALPSDRREHRYVVECEKAMQHIMELATLA